MSQKLAFGGICIYLLEECVSHAVTFFLKAFEFAV